MNEQEDTNMSITDTALKQAKPREKDYKLTDEKGMHILVTKNGGKYFKLSYRYAGKQKTLALNHLRCVR